MYTSTLTYNPNLANTNTKFQGRRSSGSAVRAETDGRTDTSHQLHYLPASQSIIKESIETRYRLQSNLEVLDIVE